MRTFLLGSLQHYLANEHDRTRTLKRGGGQQFVSMDEHLVEVEASMVGAVHPDTEICYDQAWAVALTMRAWGTLEKECAAEGKTQTLKQLEPFLIGGTNPPTLDGMAADLGIPAATLRTNVCRLRLRYREHLRMEVALTVAHPDQVDGEMQYLYRLLLSSGEGASSKWS